MLTTKILERFWIDYREIILISIRRLFNLFSKHSDIRDNEKATRIIKVERGFTKLIRKLDNKQLLDPEISKELNGTQADALRNFRSQNNSLSVFIADDQNKIARILAAIAASGSNLDRADYAIFDTALLEHHGISYEKCPGETADKEVNDLHVDLKDLTVSQVCKLVQDIQNEATLEHISKKEVEKNIINGLEYGFLTRDRINVKLKNLEIPRI